MGQFVWLLVVLMCPLMMVFMMRGMHQGHDEHSADGRIADLERQVASLQAKLDERAGPRVG